MPPTTTMKKGQSPTSALDSFRPGPLQRFRTFLFGYDIFISYSREDALYYAARLGKIMVKKGFICYLDQYHTTASKRVPGIVDQALRRSTSLVLVGTKQAVGSENVAHEITIFNEKPRNVIAINVDGELTANAKWDEMIPGLPKTRETGEAVRQGRPSRQVLSRIFDSAKFTRRNKQLKRNLVVLAAVIALLLSGTAFVTNAIVKNARRERDRALVDLNNANELKAKAENAARTAYASRDEAAAEATQARKEASDANIARDAANDAARDAHDLEVQAGKNAEAARLQQLAAEEAQRQATAERVAADGQRVANDFPARGLLLASEAQVITREGEQRPHNVEKTLRDILSATGGELLPEEVAEPVGLIALGPKGQIVIFDVSGSASLWELSAWGRSLRTLKLDPAETAPPTGERCVFPHFSPDGNLVTAVCAGTKSWSRRVWDLRQHGSVLYEKNLAQEKPGSDVINDELARWLVAQEVFPEPDPRELLARLGVATPARDSEANVASREGEEHFVHSDDWRWLARLGGGAAEVYDLKRRKPAPPLITFKHPPDDLFFSPQGRWLGTVSKDDGLTVTDLLAAPETEAPIFPQIHSLHVHRFSPDERWLVTQNDAGSVALYELKTGKPEFSVPQEYFLTEGPRDLPAEFIFSSDSQWLAVVFNGHANLWNLNPVYDFVAGRRALLPTQLFSPTDRVSYVEFSGDGRWALETVADNSGRLLRLPAGGGDEKKSSVNERPAYDLLGENGPGRFPRISPGGRWLFARARNVTYLWDLKNWSENPIVLRGQEQEVEYARCSPDDRWLATAYSRGHVRLWALDNLQAAAQPLTFDSGDFLSFSPDYHWAVTREKGLPAKLLNLRPDHAWVEPVEIPYSDETTSPELGFSPDSQWLVTFGPVARVWQISSLDAHAAEQKLALEFESERYEFSPEGHHLLASGRDGVTRIWSIIPAGDRDAGRFELKIVLNKLPTQNMKFGFSSDDRWLITSNQGAFRLVDLRGRKSDASAASEYTGVLLDSSGDGRWIVTRDGDKIRLRDLKSIPPGKQISEQELSGVGAAVRTEFSSDNHWLMVNTSQESYFWNLGSTKAASAPLKLNRQGSVTDPRISPDGRWLLLWQRDGTGHLWDLTSGLLSRSMRKLSTDIAPKDFDFSPDGRWLLAEILETDSTRGVIVAWDLRSNRLQAEKVSQTSGDVDFVFSPNSHWLATRSGRGPTSFWDLKRDEPFLIAAGKSAGPLLEFYRSSFSSDGKWVAGRTRDGLYLWDLSREQPFEMPFVFKSSPQDLTHFRLSPDGGSLVAFEGAKRKVQMWTLRTDEMIKLARRSAGRDLSDDEKRDYLPMKGTTGPTKQNASKPGSLGIPPR